MANKSKHEAQHYPKFIALGGGLFLLAILLIFWSVGRPQPQIGSDAEVFTTVDALFTAVNSQNSQRLAECEERLRAYRQAGRISPTAADELSSHIQQAKSGDWESAAKALYRLMLGQRRE